MEGEYDRLGSHLRRRSGPIWQASFADIEAIMGTPLPASARRHNAWWANQTGRGHSQARAWQEAAWRTRRLDLKAGKVDFERVGRLAPAIQAVLGAQPEEPDGDLFAEAHARTGIADRDALVRAGLRALIERETARRLIRFGGTMPDFVTPPRRRGEEG